MLTEQTENPTLKDGLQEVYLGVQKGESLASSMAKRPDVFPKLLIHMVSAGEASGSLDIAFERMAVQFEKSASCCYCHADIRCTNVHEHVCGYGY